MGEPITTVDALDALDALPVGSVVLDPHGRALQRFSAGWYPTCSTEAFDRTALPATILYHPDSPTPPQDATAGPSASRPAEPAGMVCEALSDDDAASAIEGLGGGWGLPLILGLRLRGIRIVRVHGAEVGAPTPAPAESSLVALDRAEAQTETLHALQLFLTIDHREYDTDDWQRALDRLRTTGRALFALDEIRGR